MRRAFGYFNSFQWGLLIVLLLTTILTGGLSEPIGAVASITGVLCVILVAKGSIANYYFGIVNILAYIYLAFSAQLYGDFLLNLVYYLPLQFIGIIIWKKNMNGSQVQSKVMSRNQKLYLLSGLLISIAVFGTFLLAIGGSVPYVDATSTVLSIVAMYLMIKMYAEQWLLWIVVNVVSIIMWITPFLEGVPSSLTMIIMWSAYLLNSIYGYWNWKRMSGE